MKKWTPARDQALRVGFAAGKTYADLARILKVSKVNCLERMCKLGLVRNADMVRRGRLFGNAPALYSPTFSNKRAAVYEHVDSEMTTSDVSDLLREWGVE